MQKERSDVDIRERLRVAYEAGKAAVRHFDEEPPRQQPETRQPTLPGWHH